VLIILLYQTLIEIPQSKLSGQIFHYKTSHDVVFVVFNSLFQNQAHPKMNRAALRRFEFFEVETIAEDVSSSLVRMISLLFLITKDNLCRSFGLFE